MYVKDLVLDVKEDLYYTLVSPKFMEIFVSLNAALVTVCVWMLSSLVFL
jgi:hypothetical protein